MTPERTPWQSTGEAAKYLDVHPKTLQRWVREGKLEAHRLPSGDFRYRLEDLDALLTKEAS